MSRLRAWWRTNRSEYGRHARDLDRSTADQPVRVDRTRDSLAEDIAGDGARKPSTTPVKVPRYGATVRGSRP